MPPSELASAVARGEGVDVLAAGGVDEGDEQLDVVLVAEPREGGRDLGLLVGVEDAGLVGDRAVEARRLVGASTGGGAARAASSRSDGGGRASTADGGGAVDRRRSWR